MLIREYLENTREEKTENSSVPQPERMNHGYHSGVFPLGLLEA